MVAWAKVVAMEVVRNSGSGNVMKVEPAGNIRSFWLCKGRRSNYCKTFTFRCQSNFPASSLLYTHLLTAISIFH